LSNNPEKGDYNISGLYFVGLPWIHDAKSGLLFGINEDVRSRLWACSAIITAPTTSGSMVL
jgi:hypothetical protein